MTEPLHTNSEIVKLRVSLARIAQRLGCDDYIPGHDDSEMSFAQLTAAAIKHKRGWNRLAGVCATASEGLARDVDAKRVGQSNTLLVLLASTFDALATIAEKHQGSDDSPALKDAASAFRTTHKITQALADASLDPASLSLEDLALELRSRVSERLKIN